MAYIALYREWRPQTFADLVGQEHVSRTLQNALSIGRVAHAYLFCGPRGTGKTTTAKILAKALNCLQGGEEPCNECENCRRITEGTAMDVLEIDAASNRGVDEIRELREKVKYAPSEGEYKVYIIDEVHMLTTEAFNALLKTLEEPPAKVIFILATTEAHKIPQTILSRCQRFDFRRFGIQEIIGRLEHICRHDGIAIGSDALLLIARKAEGGMRDALSILDQCISFSGKEIGVEDVTRILGAVGDGFLMDLSLALAQGNGAKGLTLLNQAVNEGKDLRQLAKDLIHHYRNRLLVSSLGEAQELVGLPADLYQRMVSEKEVFSPAAVYRATGLLSEAEGEMRWTNQPRIPLEVALVRVAQGEESSGPAVSLRSDGEVSALKERVRRLEARLEALTAGGATLSGKAAGIRENTPAQPSAGSREELTAPPWEEAKAPSRGGSPKAQPELAGAGREKVASGMEEPLAGAVDTGNLNLAAIKGRWGEVLEVVKRLRIMVQAFLADSCEPAGLEGGVLTLAFKDNYSFHRDKVAEKDNRALVEEGLKQVFGVAVKVKAVMAKDLKESEPMTRQAGPSLVEQAKQWFPNAEVVEVD